MQSRTLASRQAKTDKDRNPQAAAPQYRLIFRWTGLGARFFIATAILGRRHTDDVTQREREGDGERVYNVIKLKKKETRRNTLAST